MASDVPIPAAKRMLSTPGTPSFEYKSGATLDGKLVLRPKGVLNERDATSRTNCGFKLYQLGSLIEPSTFPIDEAI